jgi:hypothetical protein
MTIRANLPVQIVHATVDIDVAFDRFVHNFETILGRFDPGVAATFANDPHLADEQLKKMEGEQSLMVFYSQDHGGLFLLLGQKRKAMRHTLGNPRVAIQMTRHDIRAGLYVPLTLLVYEVGKNAIRVEFDTPSSLLGQFSNAEILQTAKGLDSKLDAIIEKAALLSKA